MPACAGGFPRIRGLERLLVVAPWEVEQEWKDESVRDAGEGFEVEFGLNFDATVPKPRRGPWERR